MAWILHPGQITEMLGIPAEEVEGLGLLGDSYNQQALEKRHRRLKRPHTKSRLGCLNCKRRKIKVCIPSSAVVIWRELY